MEPSFLFRAKRTRTSGIIYLMKRVLIIHGWESHSKDHWYQKEKVILESRGMQVLIPDMPGKSFPIEEDWVRVIEEFNPGPEDVLIGHSLGAPAILRFLENAKQKVGKIFLIAGFASSLNLDYPNAEFPGRFVERPFKWGPDKSSLWKSIYY